MLTDILPPAWRRYVYAALLAAGFVLGAIQVAVLTDSTASEPHWLKIAFAVLAFVSGSAHAVASSNTPAPVKRKAVKKVSE